ncbi:MAG: hypothetical protein EOM26_12470 [Alphaproteobacteria bacterium]|nr:hypothetical protein [Alphaproteobacteria bacterium]
MTESTRWDFAEAAADFETAEELDDALRNAKNWMRGLCKRLHHLISTCNDYSDDLCITCTLPREGLLLSPDTFGASFVIAVKERGSAVEHRFRFLASNDSAGLYSISPAPDSDYVGPASIDITGTDASNGDMLIQETASNLLMDLSASIHRQGNLYAFPSPETPLCFH